MAVSSQLPRSVPISFPRVSLRVLFPLLVMGWMGIHWLADFWLFHSDHAVWPAIRLHLMVEFFLLSGFMAALAFLMYRGVIHRVQWLDEEARRLAHGEAPQAALKGEDSIAKLSVAMRRMAIRIGDFWRVINEHAIVAITDAQGRIIFANDKFCAISGYQREELLGNTYQMVNSGKHPASFFEDLWRTILSGNVWSGEIENQAKNGTSYFVATTIVPCQGNDGKSHEYIAIHTDVTASKAAEGRMRQLSRELERKNRDLKTFLHAITHDLRAPLVNVQGFTEEAGRLTEEAVGLLKEAIDGTPPSKERVEALSGGMADAVRFICAGTGKMDALLEGLVAISRLERSESRLGPVDASTILEESLAAIQYQLDQSDTAVTAGPLPPCLADSGLLGQVFSNLIENAIKYRDPGRQLQLGITGALMGDQCVYRFADNGIGIEPEYRDKVFELFQRLAPRSSNGLGLGLAIVRRALDHMGGTIQVSPRPGGGTVFTVVLRQAVLGAGNLDN